MIRVAIGRGIDHQKTIPFPKGLPPQLEIGSHAARQHIGGLVEAQRFDKGGLAQGGVRQNHRLLLGMFMQII